MTSKTRAKLGARPLGKEAATAALLAVPLMGLPLLAGTSFYLHFWWQLAAVAVLGALADVAYCLALRKLLTPVVHPGRIRLRWLIAGPPLALLLLWLAHVPLALGAGITILLGLAACLLMGGSLFWDALASAVGFGALYLALYLLLGIPLHGPIELIPSFSGVLVAGHPLEEIVLVFLFGALWGPLCAAFRFPPSTNEAFHPRHQLLKGLFALLFLVLVAAGTYWTYDNFIRLPAVATTVPANGSQLKGLTSPIEITFDRPIDRRQVAVSVSPPLEGDISFADPYLQRTFVRQLIFTPSQHLAPDTAYTVTVTGLTNVLGRQSGEYALTFRTPALPSVSTVSLTTGQSDVGICDPITVRLDQAAGKLAEFSFHLLPETPLTAALGSDGTTYVLKPTDCLGQNTAYSLSVDRLLTVYGADGSLINSSDQPAVMRTVAFTTKGAPGIAGFSPQGDGILSNDKQLTLSFSEAMAASDPASFISIQPAIPGKWHWADDRTLTYDLQAALQLDTKYVVSVARGLKDARSGFLSEDASYSFATVGHVRVGSVSPRSGSGGVNVTTPIRVSFDQPVDHASAEQAFSLSPTVAGTFSWQGQTMLYSAALSKDSSYQVTESAGVVSQIGLPSQNATTASFQTEESVTLLSIPVYYQQKPLSCEAASLKMALNYKGISISEASILSSLGADATPRQGNVWGDPYQTFVGDVNGHQDSTGYGVYAAPIASVAGQYRTAQARSGLSVTEVAADLSKGNPVIFWGTAGTAQADSWSTVSGRQISGWVGEHVRLIVGFTGTAARPTGFIINDPIFGRLHWSPGQLQANWAAFNGMGVAIL